MRVKENTLSATTDTMADVGRQINVKVTTDTVGHNRQTYEHTAQQDTTSRRTSTPRSSDRDLVQIFGAPKSSSRPIFNRHLHKLNAIILC